MKETRMIMGMPVTVEIADLAATKEEIEKVFSYFTYIDEKFSTYKSTSEIMQINRGEIKEENASEDMKEVLSLSEETKKLTDGFFNIKKPDGSYDPSGLVKGWAIRNAAEILSTDGFKNYYVDAGGDIEVKGNSTEGKKWVIGIRNPFNREQNVKLVYLNSGGIATSGTYIRGQHIYDPHKEGPLLDIVSLTVIGPNIYDSDRFATAAFAMGNKGIYFIENLSGFEGYMIDKDGNGTETTGFNKYTKENASIY